MNKEEQFIEMSDAEKEVARLTLGAALDLVAKGDMRGYARLLAEAAELCKRSIAERH
ncbi:hypothetical protein [Paraburkholderia elongata]|uniref:Uncharacterized protein n=1 Tax=Paraburkholderia elongata TaxID=2675747 RepID=A0A972SNW9_9BURK|nr:hypothetical protein [Paraburkholderia elongata]NPT58110.1 hypothetical protein [Paraburkholderia elongata]